MAFVEFNSTGVIFGMTFFSILLALMLEQARALPLRNPVSTLLRYHATTIQHSFDAEGATKRSALAWLAVVLPWALAVGLVYYVLYNIHFVFAFAWNIVVVYFTLGFRQFSHYFTDIQLALNNHDIVRAREILNQWTGIETTAMPVSEIARLTLSHAVIASHRHVFGVFFWFLVPFGPAGAVLYRVSEYLARLWAESSTLDQHHAPLARFAQQAFFIIDWIPARLTALGFAIVGNFEDALYAWRNEVRRPAESNDAVLLAAGSGALGARLRGPSAEPSSIEVLSTDEPPIPVGEECTPAMLQSAIGLGWRAMVLWMLLLLMLTTAVWLG